MTVTAITTTITEPAALLRLMAWLSPAFPVGGFSYSHGLEAAVDHGLVRNADDLRAWVTALLEHGSGWNDAVLFSQAYGRVAAGEDPAEIAELAEALSSSRERHMETTLQGAAFLSAARSWPQSVPGLPTDAPYPVAVGATAAANGVPPAPALAAFLQAFVSNLLQAAIRLSVIGQTDALAILSGLEADLTRIARRAADAGLDDLGSVTILSDIMAMRHETQHSRLFRS